MIPLPHVPSICAGPAFWDVHLAQLRARHDLHCSIDAQRSREEFWHGESAVSTELILDSVSVGQDLSNN